MDAQAPTSSTAVPVVTEPSMGQTGISLNTFRSRMQFLQKEPKAASLNYMDFCIQKIKFYTYIHHKIQNRPIFMLKLNL